MATKLTLLDKKAIIKTNGTICSSVKELLSSPSFQKVLTKFVANLCEQESTLLGVFSGKTPDRQMIKDLAKTLRLLGEFSANETIELFSPARSFLKNRNRLDEFVEELYNYWREYERYLICHSTINQTESPYNTFKDTVEKLTHLVRAAYRDVCENITGKHPKIYRQVYAGANFGVITVIDEWMCPSVYRPILQDIPTIRQVLLNPPIIIDPPMNKRTGEFKRVDSNPLNSNLKINSNDWLCYPALVGPLLVRIYFHRSFLELGLSLANLFELAGSNESRCEPDAIVMFGAPLTAATKKSPTIFFEDTENDILIGTVPIGDQFGYFGYLKKMALTLHNVVMMKRGRMPFHGALARIVLKNRKTATILIIGDTGTGKSETLEAFRSLGKKPIKSITIIADDMGSLEINRRGMLVGYGTETGAFVRLDDLAKDYAYGRMDRVIIMSPQKINARAVLPVTNISEVLRGYLIDFILYANNYEWADETRPTLERFTNVSDAFHTFREGTAMAKDTTSAKGITRTIFANPFGPPAYIDLHDRIAKSIFQAAFEQEIYVGQLRTRLGVKGWEEQGPIEAAKSLLDLISSR